MYTRRRRYANLQSNYCFRKLRLLRVAPRMKLLTHANQERKGGDEAIGHWGKVEY